MSTSRRSFLKSGTLVALAAGVPLGIAETVAGATAGTPSAENSLTRAAFEAQLNTNFLVNANRKKVPVKLIEVRDLGSRNNGSKEAFSLVFTGDIAKSMEQDTYTIEHERLGTFTFLLVPVMSKNRESRTYEIVVNRLYP